MTTQADGPCTALAVVRLAESTGRATRAVVAAVVLAGLVGCHAGVATPDPPALTTLTVTLTPATIDIGGTSAATASGLDQRGAPMVPSGVTWSVSDPGVATVNGNGTVTGVGEGQAQVIASSAGVQGHAPLIVRPPTTAAVTATASSTRTTPLIGLNTNAHHSVANWTLPWFRAATASLLPAVLRYPGGTTANHWDWQTGWFQAAATTPAQFANITPKGTIRADEFQLGLTQADAEALLVINVQHSTLQYEMQGLAHAEAVGVPIHLVELGNEHNIASSFQAMPPETYAANVADWSQAIRAAWPGVRICAVGGAPPNNPGWHDAIFARTPAIDALAFHIYLGAGNGDGIFDAARALSIPFAANGGVLDRYAKSGFDDPAVPTGIEVWVTEYNLGEVLAGATKQHADTWTHALYVSAMSHLLMTIPRVTMLVNHNLTNTLDFAAIDPNTQRITANGVAMMLLDQASKDLPNASQLGFPGGPSVTSSGTTYPSLIGWRFSGGSTQKAWVVNLSASSIEVDFSQVLGGTFTWETVSGDPALQVDGRASLANAAGASVGPVTLPAYSISVLAR